MRQAVTNIILKAYTLSKGKALAGQKVVQQSVHPVFAAQRERMDAGDSAAFQAFFWLRVFSNFGFILLPSRVHARPTAANANRWAAHETQTEVH